MSENQNLSEACRISKKIYSIFETGNRQELTVYFRDQLGISPAEAAEFAAKYNPKSPPAEVCPLEAVKNGWKSSKIFEEMALQFPSINTTASGVWPKNKLAWWVLRSVFGSDVFDFNIDAEATGRDGCNGIFFPARFCDERGQFVPFGLAAIEAVGIESMPMHVIRKSVKLKNRLGAECGTALAKALIDAEFIFPPDKEINALVGAVERGLGGEEVIITGAFCPDYAYEATGDPEIPYRYTFDRVGSGVGLVAKQFVRVVPKLKAFFDAFNIQHRFVLGIGDFEANSADVLSRVGVSREEFLLRCALSLDEFQKELGDIPVELRLFEKSWANGRWASYTQEALSRMTKGDFGMILANTGKNPLTEVVRFIARSCRKFYCAWYGKEFSEAELEAIVIGQGAQYAAVGRIFAEDFSAQPLIQIAGDRPKMQAFNSMYSGHPTICTKRTY